MVLGAIKDVVAYCVMVPTACLGVALMNVSRVSNMMGPSKYNIMHGTIFSGYDTQGPCTVEIRFPFNKNVILPANYANVFRHLMRDSDKTRWRHGNDGIEPHMWDLHHRLCIEEMEEKGRAESSDVVTFRPNKLKSFELCGSNGYRINQTKNHAFSTHLRNTAFGYGTVVRTVYDPTIQAIGSYFEKIIKNMNKFFYPSADRDDAIMQNSEQVVPCTSEEEILSDMFGFGSYANENSKRSNFHMIIQTDRIFGQEEFVEMITKAFDTYPINAEPTV